MPDSDIDPEMLGRLLPYLTESIMVVRPDRTIVANLAPPGGLFGEGDRVGASSYPLQYAHPDDLPMALELAANAFVTEPGWRGASIVRARKADGEYGRYELLLENRLDDPVIAGFVARVRSIEGLDTSVYNVPQHDALVESLAEALPTAIVLIDPVGGPVFMNEAAVELLGVDLDALRRDGLDELHDEIEARTVEPGVTRVDIKRGQRTFAARLVSRGGVPGKVASIVVTLEDITDLSRRANRDALTGLPNRAAVIEAIDAQLAHDPTMVAVIYCDLDGFKLVNDRFGHAVGDRVLASVAALLRSAVRDDDLVGRIGGDEFVFVCTGLDDGQIAAVCDRVAAGMSYDRDSEFPSVTASLGVARGRAGDMARDVLHRADVAMYAAKRATEVR